MQNTTNNSASETSKHSRRNVLMDWYRNHGHTNSSTMKQSRGSEITLTHRSDTSESTFVVNGSRGSKGQIPNGSQDRSQGLLYVSRVTEELASIDKVNDPNSNTLVCAGKSQLYTYRFDPEGRTIKLVNSISQNNPLNSKVQSSALSSSSSSFLPKRSRQTKFSTIADVKCGFQSYTHYAAICTNSTSISIFNINYSSSFPPKNPIVCNFDEHKRSVNSFDFNMVQPQLLISGGQDGCAKVWDLRSSHTDGRCEVSINIAYDSIRDIKWMPGYNFAGSTVGQGGVRAHGGYKFASVHDSGILLKFDLRQPQQIEGKINAHTGPCLCLNWHPNDDYIATGGRDGKCCLWYIGDKQQQQQQLQQPQLQGFEPYSPGNFHQNHTFGEPSGSSGNTQLTSFPETTINIGFPITKLKYAPAFSSDPMNSLLGISAMGDKAQVMVYSFARRYIPKYYLGTSTSSVGFVWWDENTIFNIDKSNHMYGWDITEEPTVLDNLPKIVSTWRDIDGNGFLFVDQKIGKYDSTNPYNNKASMVDYTTGQGASNSNGSAYANGNVLNGSGNASINGGSGNNNNNNSNNSNVNASNLPLSQHTKKSSTYFNLPAERPSFSRALTTFNTKALLSSSTSSSKSHSSSPSVNSLPLQFGAPTDGLATELLQEVSSAASSATLTNATIGNGNNSSYNSSSGASGTHFYSPTIMTLDLPHIFNHMRLSQISPSNPVETVKLQESPVELFKYLAKELEFSIEREREETNDSMATLEGDPDVTRLRDDGNEQTYKDLMKRIGLSENGTWANLINKTATNTSASAHEKTGNEKLLLNISPNKVGNMDAEDLLLSSENSDYLGSFGDVNGRLRNKNKYKKEARREGSSNNAYGHSDGNSNSVDDETDYENDEQSLSNGYGQDIRGASRLSEALDTRTHNIQKRIETLLNLVSVANHNAGVYMKVNDKLNCKIWILIRDSILWDLKKMDAFVSASYEGENLDDILGYDSKFLVSSHRDKSEKKKSFHSTSADFSVPEDIDRLLAVEQSRENRKPSNAFSEAVEEEREDNANENSTRVEEGRETKTKTKTKTEPGVVKEKRSLSEDKDVAGITNGDNNTNNDHNDKSDPVVSERSNSEVLNRRNSDPVDLLTNQGRPKRASFIDTILSADYPPDSERDDGLGIFGSPGRASTRYFRKFSMSPPSLKSFHSMTPASFEDLLGLSNLQYKSPGKGTEGSSGLNPPSEEPIEDLTGAPWDAGSMLRQIFKQAAETGNILLAISILLLFQDVYHITSIEVVKNSLSEFINLLHRYELFELAAALLKYCKYDDIMGLGEGQSSIQLYCSSCGELIVNERSKERYTLELQQLQRQQKATVGSRVSNTRRSESRLNNGANTDTEFDTGTLTSHRLTRFGYWYCDLCRRPNTLCILCERPITKLCMGILKCGHQGHFECFKEWFLREGMDTCPAGCQDSLNL